MITCSEEQCEAPFAQGLEPRYPSSAMNATDPDRELVRLAQGGDMRAFEALMVKFQRRVARHVTRWVKRPSDVEDVVQEVFIKAYRGLPAFKGDSSFYTWIYQIARNTSFNFVTRQQKHVVLKDDISGEDGPEFEDTVGSDQDNPERSLLARQISDTVEAAMKRLQPDLAEALILYEVEGKPYKEIAEMLQIPIGTVRTRIFRAREFIAKRLEPVVGPVRDRRW